MPTYNIERWDAVIPPGRDEAYPMIYIKPDKDFIEYSKNNNYTVMVSISGTNTRYDEAPFVAIIDSSGYFPNDRPNFYDKTGFFVITLFSRWLGYPPNNGSVLIQGEFGPDKVEIPIEQPFKAPIPIEYFKPTEKTCDSFSATQISWIALLLLILFIGLFSISFKKSPNE